MTKMIPIKRTLIISQARYLKRIAHRKDNHDDH